MQEWYLDPCMARLTISLPDDLHRALKQAAARRDRRMGELIAESLEFYGIKTEETAAELVARARIASGLDEEDAMALSQEEVEAARG